MSLACVDLISRPPIAPGYRGKTVRLCQKHYNLPYYLWSTMTENPPSTHKRNGLGVGRPDHHRLHHRPIDGLLCDPFNEKAGAESPTLILLVHKELDRRQRPQAYRRLDVFLENLAFCPHIPCRCHLERMLLIGIPDTERDR